MSLLLGSAFIVLHRNARQGQSVAMPEHPLSDDETMQQIVGAARDFVKVGRLTDVNATYLLMSCQFDETPPYQGTAYIDFAIPAAAGGDPNYLRTLAGAMVGHGWREGRPPVGHPGGWTLTHDGVTAVFYSNPDVRGQGVLQMQGECRNATDHRMDDTGFVDIGGSLK